MMKRISVPTGTIYTDREGTDKPLEFLSIGDYGQANNIKADFLGLSNEINGVAHGELLPLSEKWVITISSQHGCSMGCTFCDVPLVGVGRNISFQDLLFQVKTAMSDHPEVTSGRINLHYARMGEPTFNRAVIDSAYYLSGMMQEKGFMFHPVVSTMMPKGNVDLEQFINDWWYFKNVVKHGDAGLQISINSTSDEARKVMFSGNALSMSRVSWVLAEMLGTCKMSGRKATLNFALTGDPIDGKLLYEYFDPDYFICKITPIHATATGEKNGINANGYDSYEIYAPVEEELKDYGFDVLVFVPSKEEDSSRITCGNAILADKEQGPCLEN